MNKYIKERSSTMEMTRPNYGMLLGVFLYHLILDLSYVCFVVPYYGYNGFDLNLNPVKLAESYIWCFGLYFLLSKKEGNVSAFFLNLEFLVMLIPMLSYYALADQSRYFMYLICLCFLMQIAVLKISPIHFPYFKGYFQFFLAMLLVFSLVVLCVAIIYNGIPTLRAFDFSNIYEIRAESRTPALFGYFINWVCKVIVPFLLVFSIYYNRRLLFYISLFIQLLMFMTYAHKTYLLIIPAILAVYCLSKKNMFLQKIYIFLPLLCLLALMLFFINTEVITLPSLLTRRFLFVPAQLKFQYYDFFSINEKVFFADGKLGALFSIESPYQQKIPFLIAQVYSGRSFSANTGYWGDAYANLGSLGVILFSLILAMVIKLIESITRNIAPSVVLSSFLFTILSLNDSALLVEFLTGGFGLLIIIYYMFDSYLYFQRQQTEGMDSIRKGRYLLSGNTRKSLLKGRLL